MQRVILRMSPTSCGTGTTSSMKDLAISWTLPAGTSQQPDCDQIHANRLGSPLRSLHADAGERACFLLLL